MHRKGALFTACLNHCRYVYLPSLPSEIPFYLFSFSYKREAASTPICSDGFYNLLAFFDGMYVREQNLTVLWKALKKVLIPKEDE